MPLSARYQVIYLIINGVHSNERTKGTNSLSKWGEGIVEQNDVIMRSHDEVSFSILKRFCTYSKATLTSIYTRKVYVTVLLANEE